MSKETDKLASDYTKAALQLAEHTTQMGGGFYQLNNNINFEDLYPNGVVEFIETGDVKDIADKAGVPTSDLLPPITLSDEAINRINEIFELDFLVLDDQTKTSLSREISNLINDISIPTADELLLKLEGYSKFVTQATEEAIIVPSNFRFIQIASTDISLDAFVNRTNTRKTDIIGLNNLVYPYITARYKVPGVLQASLTDSVGITGEKNINYTSLAKISGSGDIKAGNQVLITNNAKNTDDLKQMKSNLDYISEDSNLIRIATPLLFNVDGSFEVSIHLFSTDRILSPGESIKIPK